ncbi:unnamed protein product [Sphagnum jensenii]
MEHPVVSSLLRTMIIASDLPHPQQQHFLIDHDRHKSGGCSLWVLVHSPGWATPRWFCPRLDLCSMQNAVL